MSRRPASLPANRPLWRFAARTHRGHRRPGNEDFILVDDWSSAGPREGHEDGLLPLDSRGALLAVCDGLGGAAYGEEASRLVARIFARHLRQASAETGTGDRARQALLEAAHDAHLGLLQSVREHPDQDGMGSTLSAVWLRAEGGLFLQVGDSRVYRWRPGELRQLSTDQSPVGRLVKQGALTEEQACRHPERHVVDQVICSSLSEIQPEIGPVEVGPGDRLLICTDGLTATWTNRHLTSVLASCQHPDLAIVADRLLAEALAGPASDNISLILAEWLAESTARSATP